MSRGEPVSIPLPDTDGMRAAIVTTHWNGDVVALLRNGALAALDASGIVPDDVIEVVVPGCFEIPAAAARLDREGLDLVVLLGAVIRGETPHFDVVTQGVTHGVVEVSLRAQTAFGFGVLTVDTLEQALERADPARLDKGGEAARTAVAMTNVLRHPFDRG